MCASCAATAGLVFTWGNCVHSRWGIGRPGTGRHLYNLELRSLARVREPRRKPLKTDRSNSDQAGAARKQTNWSKRERNQAWEPSKATKHVRKRARQPSVGIEQNQSGIGGDQKCRKRNVGLPGIGTRACIKRALQTTIATRESSQAFSITTKRGNNLH